MIVRIMGEGQFELPAHELDALNALDEVIEITVKADDELAFATALHDLHDRVRTVGRRLPDERLVPSDFVLPPDGVSIAEVRALFDADGLVPG